MTLQDDEDEDFPESVYTLKDGIPAKSTLIALCLESVFFFGIHRAIRLSHPFRFLSKDRGTFDDFLKGHERALVEFYAPLPEGFPSEHFCPKFLPIFIADQRPSGQGHGVDIASNWSQNTTRQQMLFEPLLAKNEINISSQEHQFVCEQFIYPLVNFHIAMENHHF